MAATKFRSSVSTSRLNQGGLPSCYLALWFFLEFFFLEFALWFFLEFVLWFFPKALCVFPRVCTMVFP